VRTLRDFAPPVPVNWLAVLVSLVALALIAGEGVAPHHGLLALTGLIALVAALPALFHPIGVSAPLVVAVVALVGGGAFVAT
jgi:membrane-bound ClpP family serine protease